MLARMKLVTCTLYVLNIHVCTATEPLQALILKYRLKRNSASWRPLIVRIQIKEEKSLISETVQAPNHLRGQFLNIRFGSFFRLIRDSCSRLSGDTSRAVARGTKIHRPVVTDGLCAGVASVTISLEI